MNYNELSEDQKTEYRKALARAEIGTGRVVFLGLAIEIILIAILVASCLPPRGAGNW